MEFPSPYESFEVGHKGNGVIKITCLVPGYFKTCAVKNTIISFVTKYILIMFIK